MVAVKLDPTDSASGIHNSRYAADRKQLIGLINAMRACGVATELDLPRVAIIGNQSAGKSSLVEAISGIRVPRDAGTCTRCPFEVRLQHSPDAWYCKISIRFETGEDGRPLEKIAETPFGVLIRDPENVEAALRRAQLAVLNPSVSPADWAKATDEDVKKAKEGLTVLGSKKQLSFSTNLVCIDIAGPEVTDLAFLDLPGIISNVDEGEDEANIALIRNLVTKTIDGNCLILLTLSMRDDLENQSAMKLAREADEGGKRTIGVLTKPDTLQEGEHDRWLQVLRGERARLVNGYFSTKQPGAADLAKNLSFEDAREAEKNFFLSTQPWSSLSSEVQRRLGTAKLTEYLSDKLSTYIKQKLPEIRATVSDALSTAETSLHALPPPPSEDASGELIRLFTDFRYELDSYVRGSLEYESLLQQAKIVSSTFATNIRATRPRFAPFDKTDDRYEESAIFREKVVLYDLTDLTGNRRLCDETTNNLARFVLEMSVGEVRDFLKVRKTRETPLNSPFGAKAALMVETTKSWNALTMNALDALREPVSSTLGELVEKHFGRYIESGLKSIVLDIVAGVVDKLMVECRRSLTHLLKAEASPFTENEHYYRSSKEKTLADFTEQRRTGINLKAPTIDQRAHLDVALSKLRAAGMSVKYEDLAKLFPTDDYAEELDAMAHVAYKRIIDNVPRFIDLDIVRELPDAMSNAFVAKINYRDTDVAARLLAEGFEVQEERHDLHKRIQRIGEAKELLSSFGKK
ncbi:hypothetical protein JCM11491_003826 [Sporobolomyces phaffii]